MRRWPLALVMSTKPRFPGNQRSKAAHAGTALWLLLDRYMKHEPVRDDFMRSKPGDGRAFAERWNLDSVGVLRERNYRQLDFALSSLIKTNVRYFSSAAAYAMPKGFRDDPENPLAQCVSPEVSFVSRAPVHEFAGTIDPTKSYGHSGRWPAIEMPERPAEYFWTWNLEHDECLADFRKRIMNDLAIGDVRTLPRTIREQLWDLPDQARRHGWELIDGNHALARHADRLFQRLCPLPEFPRSYRKIAEIEYGLEPGTMDDGRHNRVARPLTRLVRLLRIHLPPTR